jgi:hypothetical protein
MTVSGPLPLAWRKVTIPINREPCDSPCDLSVFPCGRLSATAPLAIEIALVDAEAVSHGTFQSQHEKTVHTP